MADRPDLAEFDLVVACSVWPRSAAQTARVRALAGEHVDWDRVARIAVRHGVSALVVDALEQADIAVPDRLLRVARRRVTATLRQAGEAVRLRKCFADADIPVLFLKGTALAVRLFGRIELRDAVDIDLAVAADNLPSAWRILDQAGYRRIIPRQELSPETRRLFVWAAKDSFHRHGDHGMVVELHWRLSDDLPDPGVPPLRRWQEVAAMRGEPLATLADEELFIYLCTHGAAHLWARLKWLVDVGAMISASDDGGMRYWARAQASGAGRAAASAFFLLNELMGRPLPEGFPVSRPLRVQALNWLTLRVIRAGDGERDLADTAYRGWAELTAKLLIAPGMANLLSVVRRVLFSAEDIGALGLPMALSFLYPLLRIPLLIVRRWRRSARRSTGYREPKPVNRVLTVRARISMSIQKVKRLI